LASDLKQIIFVMSKTITYFSESKQIY